MNRPKPPRRRWLVDLLITAALAVLASIWIAAIVVLLAKGGRP